MASDFDFRGGKSRIVTILIYVKSTKALLVKHIVRWSSHDGMYYITPCIRRLQDKTKSTNIELWEL